MLSMLICAVLSAENPATTDIDKQEQIRFFETSIRPLFAEHCLKCHGDKKQWGGLRLDSREAILQGGDTGPAIVSGQPRDSLLIRVVRHEIDGLNMPKDSKLSARQIDDLIRWVEMGAPFPAPAPSKARSRDPNHWSFQPLAEPALPAVKNVQWPRSPLDQYILARLEVANVAPAAAS